MTRVLENIAWEVLEDYPLKVKDFDKTSFDLITLPVQQEGRWCSGFEILQCLTSDPEAIKAPQPLTAACLEYLLENQNKIPEEFEGKHAVFFGTVYRPVGTKNIILGSVRVLYQDTNEDWTSRHKCLDSDFNTVVITNKLLRLAVVRPLG